MSKKGGSKAPSLGKGGARRLQRSKMPITVSSEKSALSGSVGPVVADDEYEMPEYAKSAEVAYVDNQAALSKMRESPFSRSNAPRKEVDHYGGGGAAAVEPDSHANDRYQATIGKLDRRSTMRRMRSESDTTEEQESAEAGFDLERYYGNVMEKMPAKIASKMVNASDMFKLATLNLVYSFSQADVSELIDEAGRLNDTVITYAEWMGMLRNVNKNQAVKSMLEDISKEMYRTAFAELFKNSNVPPSAFGDGSPDSDDDEEPQPRPDDARAKLYGDTAEQTYDAENLSGFFEDTDFGMDNRMVEEVIDEGDFEMENATSAKDCDHSDVMDQEYMPTSRANAAAAPVVKNYSDQYRMMRDCFYATTANQPRPGVNIPGAGRIKPTTFARIYPSAVHMGTYERFGPRGDNFSATGTNACY